MRYIVELRENDASRIGDLIDSGKYRDVHSFIEVAIQNQLYLEEQEIEAPPHRTEQTIQLARTGGELANIPEVRVRWKSLVPVDPAPLERLWSTYLWGQYNRIFPAKIAMRVLANTLDSIGSYAGLDEAQESAAKIARSIGLHLRSIDKKKHLKRGEALSTALPIGRDLLSSTQRYKSQFVGYSTKTGTLHGMPLALGFANILDGKKIGITPAGVRFAETRNPILDDEIFEATLSSEEILFYRNHVSQRLPDESKAMETVVDAVARGINTHEGIVSRMKAIMNSDWSDVVVSTMANGLLGRMRELRMISVRKKGVRSIFYVVEPLE